MSKTSWWRHWLKPAVSRTGRRRSIRRGTYLVPFLEQLESRITPATTLSIADSGVTEPMPSGTVNMDFTVTRTGDLTSQVTVGFTTVAGTAQPTTDFTPTTGTTTFASGSATATISIPVFGNGVFNNPSLTFSVQLTGVVNVVGPPVTFTSHTDFALGLTPFLVATGDINGDGKPDLVFATNDTTSYSVVVLLNTTAPGATTPTFAPAADFATGRAPLGVAIGDLNGDGKPDLAVSNQNSNSVSVLLNTTAPGATTPSFAGKQDFTVGNEPVSVAIDDFNGDGEPDLAVANKYSASVSVLLNTTAPGATTSTFAADQEFATSTFPRSVSVGDVNGDGKPDLVVSSADLSVLLNTTAPGAATPTFTAKQSFPGGGINGGVVRIDDVNGDGKPDLIAPTQLLTNMTAPGAPTASFAVSGSGFGIAAAVGDLNGDGKPDVASVILGNPMVEVTLNTTVPGAAPTFAPPADFGTGTTPYSVAIADFNGDGLPDLAVANRDSKNVSVLLNTTVLGAATITPDFPQAARLTVGSNPYTVALGDLNGDGKPDLAVANFNSNSVSVLLNTTAAGSATTTFAPTQDFPTGTHPIVVVVADLNGDDKPDLAAANRDGVGPGTLSVLLNTTAPGATTPTFAPNVEFPIGTYPSSVAVGDLNGDGKPDLAVANSLNTGASTLSVLLNTTPTGAASPSFAPTVDIPTQFGPSSVALADFNGDGRPDIVYATPPLAGTVSVLLNTTAPGATTLSFAPRQDFTTGVLTRSVAVSDLNGDGLPDLAVAFSSSNVAVLLNTTPPGVTTLTFAPKQDFPTGALPVFVTAGDVNGDGKPDLITANQTGGSISVLLNATVPGTATPAFASQDFSADPMGGSAPFAVAIGDLNGDGRADVSVGPRGSSNTISVLLNTPVTIVGNTAVGTIIESDPSGTQPTVQFATATQSVNENAGSFSMTVTLSAAASQDISVPFTLGGTAVSGTDFSGVTANPLIIPAGQTSGTITGTLIDDGKFSPTNNMLVVTLGTPINATLGTTTTDTLTILESDPQETGSEPPLLGGTPVTVNGMERSELTNVTVATFTHNDGSEPGTAITATIDWGDGTTTDGTVSQTGETNYKVTGTHNYADEGNVAITVQVTDETASITIHSSANIQEELLPDGTRGTPNQRFIAEIYHDLLRRTVDAAGLAGWSSQLDQGARRFQVVSDIEHDHLHEFFTLEVIDAYHQFLKRDPDPTGLQLFVDFLAGGATVEQVNATIAGSREYRQARAGGTTGGFLTPFYQDLFGRDVDPDGQQTWGQALAAGASPEQVALAILNSDEYRGGLVRAEYLRFLDRAFVAGPDGASALTRFPAGTTDDVQIAAILGDVLAEFFNKTVN
jgi:hypothetical protein